MKYLEFINESKVTDLKPGVKVMFNGKFRHEGGPLTNLDKITGVVKSIRKERWATIVTFTLDKEVPLPLYLQSKKKKTTNEIKLTSYQLRNVDILDDSFVDMRNKIASGEIAKFQATKDFMWILKGTKFKRKGDYFDISYLDIIKDNPDYISFIPSKKSIGADFEKFRQISKIGRILRKLNPDLSDKEIEDYVDKYKAEMESYLSEPIVDVVRGKDISHWYHQKMYQKGGGSLNNSCMRYANEQSSVKFYDQFPDKIALATYVKGGRLWARALVWRLDDGRVYMDRIYSVDAKSAIQLEKYAIKHNMLMHKNRYEYKIARGFREYGKLKVTLGVLKWDNEYPYFDTFRRSDRTTKKIILFLK